MLFVGPQSDEPPVSTVAITAHSGSQIRQNVGLYSITP
jgi:hypothetical protein